MVGVAAFILSLAFHWPNLSKCSSAFLPSYLILRAQNLDWLRLCDPK